MQTILRQRSLLILGAAESVSGLGAWITMLAVMAIVVFRGAGGVAQSSGIFLAGLLPTLLFSPLAGWLCDRVERRRLMVASQLLNALAVSGLIFARSDVLIYALLAIQAALISVLPPARQSLIPSLVGRDDLTRANAFLQQLSAIVKIFAPVLAGAILAVLDPHTAIVVDVACITTAAFILSRLPAQKPAAPVAATAEATTEPSRASAGTRDLLASFRGSARLRLLFSGAFLSIIVIVGFDVLSSVLTRDILRGDESLLGLLIGLVGAGSTAAAAWLLFGKRRRSPWKDVSIGLALLACLPASAALAAGLATPQAARLALALGCLVGGVGNGLIAVQTGTLLQQESPPALLGRMAGLYQSTAVAGQLVGILAAPVLVPGLLPLGSYFAGSTVLLGLLAAAIAWVVARSGLRTSAGLEAVAAEE